MRISEVISKMSEVSSTYSWHSVNFYHFILHGPNLPNKLSYSFVVPFAFTAYTGIFCIIDLSKAKDILEIVLNEYFFVKNISFSDLNISLFSKIVERQAYVMIKNDFTDEHMQIIKNNSVILNQIIVKITEQKLIDQVNSI